MDLEVIMLSEVSQKEKDKCYMISLNVESIRKDPNKFIYKTEIDSQT